MASRQNTNPWGDAANQAVGALYKYYATMPTAADKIKMQLQQAQLDQMQKEAAMGPYTMQNLSPEIRNDLYMQEQMKRGADAAGRFRDIMFKPSQVDLGDRKAMMGMGGIVPGTEYTMGVAPKTEFDKEGNRLVTTPAIPSQHIDSPMANLFAAVVQQESGGNPMAMSPAGAAGIAQIMPDTARDPGYGVAPLAGWDGVDPRTAPVNEQLRFGNDYMNAMIKNRGGNVAEGLAAYNAGPGAVAEHGGVPPYPETQNYVQKVMDTAGMGPTTSQGGAMITQLPKTADTMKKENDQKFSQGVKMSGLDQTVSSALYNIQHGGAGVGSYAKDIPFVGGQTSAANLDADLSKITNAAAIDEIARLKEESKTGGFFGNLSDGERQAVADSQLAIRQSMNPQELAYRLLQFQDLKNDIIFHRGQTDPTTGEAVPLDANGGRSGLPSLADIQNAQSTQQLEEMWNAFDKYPVFQGRPPKMIDDALADRYNQLRGGQ